MWDNDVDKHNISIIHPIHRYVISAASDLGLDKYSNKTPSYVMINIGVNIISLFHGDVKLLIIPNLIYVLNKMT